MTKIDHPAFPLAARALFDYQPLHQCYWNNRFCIAVLCDMEWHLQRLAAWCAVSNGLNEYWEWTTHSGFDMSAVLKHLGILDPGFVTPPPELYFDLDRNIAAAIIQYFKLPTTVFGVKKILTDPEKEERDHFNRIYPYIQVL